MMVADFRRLSAWLVDALTPVAVGLGACLLLESTSLKTLPDGR